MNRQDRDRLEVGEMGQFDCARESRCAWAVEDEPSLHTMMQDDRFYQTKQGTFVDIRLSRRNVRCHSIRNQCLSGGRVAQMTAPYLYYKIFY